MNHCRSFQCSECRQEWVSRKVFWCGRCRRKEKECGCVTMVVSQERVRQVVCRQDRAQHEKVSSACSEQTQLLHPIS